MATTKGNTQINQVVEISAYVVDSGVADAYIVTLRPGVPSYTPGLRFFFQAVHANTGASTLNVNGLGIKSIKKDVSLSLVAGDILANQIIEVAYDGTNFQIITGIGGSGGGDSGFSGYSGLSGYSGYSGQFPGVLYNRQTVNYTLVLGDAGKAIEMNKSTANTVTVPTNASVAFPIGTEILITQYGIGQTSISPAGGVTVDSVDGSLSLTSQFSAATLSKVGTNEWYLWGDILPAANSGYSGYSGVLGTSGYSGYSAVSGYSGFSGKSGYSGSGVSGYSGFSGYSGANPGASGYSGYSGISGYSGNNPGSSGYSGYSGVSSLSVNSQATDYTLVLGDAVNVLVEMTKSTASTLTIPTNASAAIAIGSQIPCYASGTGQVTIAGSIGVTLHSADGATKSRVQYSSWTLTKTATNTWLISGDVTV